MYVWYVFFILSPRVTFSFFQEFTKSIGNYISGRIELFKNQWMKYIKPFCFLWQVLTGHTDEIFSCGFTYDGNTIITASKDNTCQLWKARSGQKEQEEGVNNKTNVTTSLDFECTGTMSVWCDSVEKWNKKCSLHPLNVFSLSYPDKMNLYLENSKLNSNVTQEENLNGVFIPKTLL